MPPSISLALRRVNPTHPSVLTLTRAFGTTSISLSNKIPPESPAYLDTPIPPQSQAVEDQRISPLAYKGHLPIPRKIFRKRAHQAHKTSPTFLAKTAKEPSSPSALQPAADDYVAWKRRMAASRRQNLQEGIQLLWARKHKTEQRRAEIQKEHADRNLAALNAPQREDERLTESSIPGTLLQTAVPRDPQAFEKALKSRKRTSRLATQKSRDRKDALQHLYMMARSFIVTEEELTAQVEKVFSPDYFRQYGTTPRNTEISNIWDRDGLPPSVAQMMGQVTKGSAKGILDDDQTFTSKRQQRLAEELTGGSLEEPNTKL